MSESSNRTTHIAILLFDNVELLDFAGPYEVFSLVNRDGSTDFRVFTVAERAGPITTHNGLSVVPHKTLDSANDIDILVVPGGIGTRHEMNNARLIDWIRNAAERAELVLSVCTGALLLGKAGLLDHLEATTHHDAYNLLRELVPTATVHENRRFVDCERIVTSAGIAAGIDMSLHVVKRIVSDEVARAVAEQMEYPYFAD